jgi:hypothetical protein
MGFGHRMIDRADFHGNGLTVHFINGDVLFDCRVRRAGDDLLHGLAAAHDRHACFPDYGDYLAARFTTVKSEFHIYLLSEHRVSLIFFECFYFVKYLLVLVEEEEYRADETRDRGDYRRDTEAHLTA